MDVTLNNPVLPGVEDIIKAHQLIKDVTVHTPLQKNQRLSDQYACSVYLKREDLQIVRSFKIRGAYHKMKKLDVAAREKGIVCASAGNHAQGVAYSCSQLNIRGSIFMPATTPRQKVDQVRLFGGNQVEILLTGDTFDDAYHEALSYCESNGRTFIHPFDDFDVIAGQGTMAIDILNDCPESVDYLFASAGGGGLMAGLGTYFHAVSPQTSLIAAEPAGAASLKAAFDSKKVVEVAQIEKFVDGAAVQKVGSLTYEICKSIIKDIVLVPEGRVCTEILKLYNTDAIVVEPAGALPIAALDMYSGQIKGKTVVCVISGGNNDIDRMQDIKERSMIYEGLQHYFIVHFPQRAGALREFLDEVLGPQDDINRFEYTKKNNKESGPAVVGIELKQKEDYFPLISRMDKKGFSYMEINKDKQLFHLLI
ncbi:threonine ammonia-lyase IlvA [Bacillus lacus]|uniref:L-threonine dehydratase n=1 Tax=Metabacillus lacus TaxID=1983721 RepID=A0A7X2LX48_9BACI|nr:threonine ammonia-lyase IlvA [Metabacillus lacus]MRX70896.1 threonine ammonia-lyase IlvA [Metabacillus lacus]